MTTNAERLARIRELMNPQPGHRFTTHERGQRASELSQLVLKLDESMSSGGTPPPDWQHDAGRHPRMNGGAIVLRVPALWIGRAADIVLVDIEQRQYVVAAVERDEPSPATWDNGAYFAYDNAKPLAKAKALTAALARLHERAGLPQPMSRHCADCSRELTQAESAVQVFEPIDGDGMRVVLDQYERPAVRCMSCENARQHPNGDGDV